MYFHSNQKTKIDLWINLESTKEYNEIFNERIVKLLKNNGRLKDISNMIYGHTHSCQDEVRYEFFDDRNNQHIARIYNTGCWEHPPFRKDQDTFEKKINILQKPTYIEINMNS